MILEGSGPPARHPAIPNWLREAPGTSKRLWPVVDQGPHGEAISPVPARAYYKYFTETLPDKGRCVVTNLKQYIASQYGARRPSRPHAARRSVPEAVGDARV